MKDFVKSEKGKIMYWIIGIISTVIFAIILVPSWFDACVNKVDPFICGVPFFAFMEFILLLILACMLALLHWVQDVRGEL